MWQLKPMHPELAAVAERTHEMNLKETVNTIVSTDVLRAVLKVNARRDPREKVLIVELAQRIVELRPKHPVFAAIIERGHQMDLGETVAVVVNSNNLGRHDRARPNGILV